MVALGIEALISHHVTEMQTNHKRQIIPSLSSLHLLSCLKRQIGENYNAFHFKPDCSPQILLICH